jgi:hypothetical protein
LLCGTKNKEPVLKDEVDVAPEILSVEPKCELPVEYKLKESRGGAPAPKNWQIVLDTLIEYRRTHLAPVDTHGCDSFKHYVTDPKTSRYEESIWRHVCHPRLITFFLALFG